MKCVLVRALFQIYVEIFPRLISPLRFLSSHFADFF